MSEELTIADYEAAFEDHRRLVRELDVIMNGDDAAPQASLCDLVGQIAQWSRIIQLARGTVYARMPHDGVFVCDSCAEKLYDALEQLYWREK